MELSYIEDFCEYLIDNIKWEPEYTSYCNEFYDEDFGQLLKRKGYISINDTKYWFNYLQTVNIAGDIIREKLSYSSKEKLKEK